MEKIELISNITVAIVSALSGAGFNKLFNSPFLNAYRKKTFKTEELNKLKEYFKENAQSHFESFILPTHKEHHFYIETGIRTNHLSIPKYINLKNKLGANYTWYKIKTAITHFNLDGEQIEIKLSKIKIVLMKFWSIISFLFILSAVLIMGLIDYTDELKTKLAIVFTIVSLFSFGFILTRALDPIHTAYHMQKRLNQLND